MCTLIKTFIKQNVYIQYGNKNNTKNKHYSNTSNTKINGFFLNKTKNKYFE